MPEFLLENLPGTSLNQFPTPLALIFSLSCQSWAFCKPYTNYEPDILLNALGPSVRDYKPEPKVNLFSASTQTDFASGPFLHN